MGQIILVHSDEKTRNDYVLDLKNKLGAEVIPKKNAKETIEFLSILADIDLIITEKKIQDIKASDLIRSYINQNQLDIPILTLQSKINSESLIQEVSMFLDIDLSEKKPQKNKYCSININYFYQINESPCDVFIKIKENEEFKFIKRLIANDRFEKEDIDSYVSNGLKKLYIHTDYKKYFVTHVTNKIIQKLENESLPLIDRLKSNSNAFDIVKEKINIDGLDEETIELATASIKSMIIALDQTPVLSELLKMLLSDKISYAYQKSHFLCLIGEFILSKQSWYTKKHLEVFAFCSFFNDITLKNKRQMLIMNEKELNKSYLTEEEKNQVLTHAKDASNICKDHPDYTEYIHLILIQHHGSDQGIGMHNGKIEELHSISKVFIIADNFVSSILDPDKAKNKIEIIENLKLEFSHDSYLKIIKILEQRID